MMPLADEVESFLSVAGDPAREAEARPAASAMLKSVGAATVAERSHALARVAGAIPTASASMSGLFALVCGALAEHGAAAGPLVSATLERGPAVFHQAVLFGERCEELAAAEPASDDQDESPAGAVERFGKDVGEKMPMASKQFELSRQYASGLISALARSAELRRVVAASSLLAVTDALSRFHAEASYALTLMEVLDEELLVFYPATRAGFRVRIGGIADNFQLNTLLAAALVGPDSVGKLPGEPVPSQVTKALTDGGVDPEYADVWGTLNLCNWVALDADGKLGPASEHTGAWVWNEGRPADILPFEGTRVVLLETPPYERSWQVGRLFPGMVASVEVTATLSREEVESWLRRMGSAPRPT